MTIIENGSLGRIIREFEYERKTVPAGELVIIEDYAPETDDPDMYSNVYMASYRGGYNNLVIEPGNVEQILDPEETAHRKLPTREEIVEGLMSDLAGSSGEEWYAHGADDEGDGEITVYGITNDGLEFAFSVVIGVLGRADY